MLAQGEIEPKALCLRGKLLNHTAMSAPDTFSNTCIRCSMFDRYHINASIFLLEISQILDIAICRLSHVVFFSVLF